MIQELVILGVLKKEPCSGYDIKKFIDKELALFSPLETESIYYTLKKLEEDGLITKEALITKQYPKKYVYSITSKGEKEFLQTCKKVMLSQEKPFIETDLVLFFLPFLGPQNILPLLRLRLRFLEKVKAWLCSKDEQLKKSPKNLRLLISHQFTLASAEREFLKEVIAAVKKKEL